MFILLHGQDLCYAIGKNAHKGVTKRCQKALKSQNIFEVAQLQHLEKLHMTHRVYYYTSSNCNKLVYNLQGEEALTLPNGDFLQQIIFLLHYYKLALL